MQDEHDVKTTLTPDEKILAAAIKIVYPYVPDAAIGFLYKVTNVGRVNEGINGIFEFVGYKKQTKTLKLVDELGLTIEKK